MPGLHLPGAGADPEGHRDGRERVRATLEDGARLMRRPPAHVDAGDPDAAREARGGAREGEAQHDPREGRKHREDHGSLPELAALGTRAATSPGPDQEVFAPRRQGREV